MNKSDARLEVVLEDINGKFDRLIEAMSQLQDEVRTCAKQSELDEVKADIKTVKAAVTDTNHQVQNHERRITSLESV